MNFGFSFLSGLGAMQVEVRSSGIRRDFQLPGDSIEVPRLVLEVTLKPLLEEEVPWAKFHESGSIWLSVFSCLRNPIPVRKIGSTHLDYKTSTVPTTQAVQFAATPAHCGWHSARCCRIRRCLLRCDLPSLEAGNGSCCVRQPGTPPG